MFFKKIFTLAASMFLCFTIASTVLADGTLKITTDNVTREILIEGTTKQYPGTVVTLNVLDPDAVLYNQSEPLVKQSVFIGEATVKSDYTYTANIRLKPDAKSGEYKLNIFVQGDSAPSTYTFNFSNVAMANDVVSVGKESDKTAFRNALDAGVLHVDVAYGKNYNEFTDAEKEYVSEKIYKKFHTAESAAQNLDYLKELLQSSVDSILKVRAVTAAAKDLDRAAVRNLLTENEETYLISQEDKSLFNGFSDAIQEKVIVELTVALKKCVIPEDVALEYGKAVKASDVPEKTPKSPKPSNGGAGRNRYSGDIAISSDISNGGSIAVKSPDADFSDIGSVPWASKAITVLSDHDIINGKGNGLYCPLDAVKREELVKLLVKSFGIISPSQSALPFNDAVYGEWYYDNIVIAHEMKIANGISDTEFGIGMNVTRQDMAVLIYNTLKAVGKAPKSSGNHTAFTDGDNISDYAKEAVNVLSDAGIITGMPDGTFAPTNTATRAEAAKLLYEVLYRFNIL